MIYSFLMKNWWKIQRKSSALWINYREQCIAVNTEATPPLLWQPGDLRRQGWDCAFCQLIQCRENIHHLGTLDFEERSHSFLKFSQNVISFTGSPLLGTISVCLRQALTEDTAPVVGMCFNLPPATWIYHHPSIFQPSGYLLFTSTGNNKNTEPLSDSHPEITRMRTGAVDIHLSWSYTSRNKVSMEDK